MSRLTRRTALRLGAGTAGLCALGPLLDAGMATAVGAPPPVDPSAPAPGAPTLQTGSFASAARNGADTRWVIARPPGHSGPLRTVIALHGRDGNADAVMALGVEAVLAQMAGAGGAPFAVVAVDGGNGYWHKRVSGEDSGAMVLNELLPMLATQGLDTSRVGFIGWSMGGYGALLLGGMLGPARTSAICAVSPALYTNYLSALAGGAFDGPVDFSRYSVFGAPALSAIPLRVDCGTSDRFYPATKRFVASLSTPPAGVAYPGGHDHAGWRQQLPAELAWMAGHA